MTGWELDSGVERQAERPYTFEIPPEAVRSRLVPWCFAKLMFRMQTDDGERVERMWVKITGYRETAYVAELINEPASAGAPVHKGMEVEFLPDHIIDCEPPENWNPETKQYED